MINDCKTCFYRDIESKMQPCLECKSPTFIHYVPMTSFIDDGEDVDDVVNSPDHYQLIDGMEVRDILEILADKVNQSNIPTTPLFTADYVQLMQYLMRFMEKNGVEDLKKARYYLNKLIEAYYECALENDE